MMQAVTVVWLNAQELPVTVLCFPQLLLLVQLYTLQAASMAVWGNPASPSMLLTNGSLCYF
jgi:hypothetical protein